MEELRARPRGPREWFGSARYPAVWVSRLCHRPSPWRHRIVFGRPQQLLSYSPLGAHGLPRWQFLNGLCGRADHVQHDVRFRQHDNVAAIDGRECGTHTLCDKLLQLRVYGLVVRSPDEPARLRLPGGTVKPLVEQVCGWRVMSRPKHLLLLLRKISGEMLDAVGKHPDAAL